MQLYVHLYWQFSVYFIVEYIQENMTLMELLDFPCNKNILHSRFTSSPGGFPGWVQCPLNFKVGKEI